MAYPLPVPPGITKNETWRVSRGIELSLGVLRAQTGNIVQIWGLLKFLLYFSGPFSPNLTLTLILGVCFF